MTLVAIVESASAAVRVDAALRWIAERLTDQPILVVGSTLESAGALIRQSVGSSGGMFGWRRTTLDRLAASHAEPALLQRGLATAGTLAALAVTSRALDR